MRNRALLAVLVLCLVVITAGIAFAAAGPHGNYATTTNKCILCHRIHNSATSNLMLGATVYATCRTCHTTGSGLAGLAPYDYIVAPGAQHTCEVTTAIPGGSGALPENLSCNSCHSPHDNNVVTAYTDDDTQGVSGATSHLLKQAGSDVPTPPVGWGDLRGAGTTAYAFYGGGWCADCHNQRMSGGSINNHPSSLTASYASLGLAGSSTNYHLTPATDPPPSGTARPFAAWWLVCQSCHEDSRNAESVFAYTTHAFGASDNPFYKDFPHETQNVYFKVEGASGAGDDLCLNCHAQSNLP